MPPGFDPAKQNADNVLLILFGQCNPLGHAMPFGETTAAARRRGVLRHEDRMAAPRSLSAVVARFSGGETGSNEFRGLFREARPAQSRQLAQFVIP